MNGFSSSIIECMNQAVEQIQKENKTLGKARAIAASKRVRRCKANRNIWLVGSGNPKTQKVFYCVMWNEELDSFVCTCKSFQFRMNNPCVHVYAIYEGQGHEERRSK